MIFNLDTTTVTLEKPAQYPYNEATRLVQAKERSASGITHVESFQVLTGDYTYNFEDMSPRDYTVLMEFFVNVAEGMLNEFNLTDDLNVTRLVRFASPDLEFSKDSYELWAGSFSVEQVI